MLGDPMNAMSQSKSSSAAITRWLADQRGAMLALLEEVVNIDSGSYDKPGVDAVGERFKRFFAENGIATTTIPNDTYGEAIRADVAGSGGSNKPILLMGHRDTVFPKGEVARRPFRIENGRAYGPGVCDMKAGLVMNAFVLAATKSSAGRRPRSSGSSPRTRRSARPPAGRSSRTPRGRRGRSSTRSRAARQGTSSPAARAACSCA
jgi:Peptidase family M20/M25/M40